MRLFPFTNLFSIKHLNLLSTYKYVGDTFVKEDRSTHLTCSQSGISFMMANRWSDIQPELLEEILRKLTLVDYLNCRRVCQSWRRIVKDAMSTKGACLPVPQFPFLMLFPPYFDMMNTPTTLSDITQENTTSYTIPAQVWKGYFDNDRVFSVKGWLVFQKTYYNKNQNYNLLQFFNPVSGEKFELPHLPLFTGQDFTSQISVKLVFSSAQPNSSDFLAVTCAALHQGEYPWMQLLAFCKATDKNWTLFPIPTDQSRKLPFDEFILHGWKLYAMSKFVFLSGSVTVFNLTDSTTISFEKLEKEPIQMARPYSGRIDGVLHISYGTCMLATDGDEILLVVHHVRSCLKSEIFCETTGFCIFKLDMCGSARSRWIEVDDLGDRVLLMDSGRVQVISVKEINLTGKFSGGNCVFFCFSKFNRCDLGVFSLKDKRITRFPLGSSEQVPGRPCLWFTPSPW